MRVKFGKVAIIIFLAPSVLGAGVVAPTKSEVEAMYTAAAAELKAGHDREALAKLDALEARQPDVAAAYNLRGVILMRLRDFRPAETALRKARELDPDFAEARFNLAEVAFLGKQWAEARRRFTDLLAEPNERWKGATGDLVQFKVLLTSLLLCKEKESAPILEKLQAATESPALYYAKAALALRHKDRKAADSWMKTASQEFSPELNKLFAESFYEVGWLDKPKGAAPVALELISPNERVGRAEKDLARAEDAYRRGDFAEASRLLDDIEKATPGQAVAFNLRGQVFLAQGKFEEAGAALQSALEVDPQLLVARYNLTRVAIARKEYDQARKDLEALLAAASGGKDQIEQLIRYQIFLTLLAEGREGPAQNAMDQFKMMDGSPALYYAQAAWSFQHGNFEQGNNWVANAGNLFSRDLNRSFAFPLADLGWLKPPGTTTQPSLTPAAVAQKPSPQPTTTPVTVAQKPTAKPTATPAAVAQKPTPSPTVTSTVVAQKPTAKPTATTPAEVAKQSTPQAVASPALVAQKPTPAPTVTPAAIAQKAVAKPTATPSAVVQKTVPPTTVTPAIAARKPAAQPSSTPAAVAQKPAARPTATPPAVAQKPTAKPTATPVAVAQKPIAQPSAAPAVAAQRPVAKSTATPVAVAPKPTTQPSAAPAVVALTSPSPASSSAGLAAVPRMKTPSALPREMPSPTAAAGLVGGQEKPVRFRVKPELSPGVSKVAETEAKPSPAATPTPKTEPAVAQSTPALKGRDVQASPPLPRAESTVSAPKRQVSAEPPVAKTPATIARKEPDPNPVTTPPAVAVEKEPEPDFPPEPSPGQTDRVVSAPVEKAADRKPARKRADSSAPATKQKAAVSLDRELDRQRERAAAAAGAEAARRAGRIETSFNGGRRPVAAPDAASEARRRHLNGRRQLNNKIVRFLNPFKKSKAEPTPSPTESPSGSGR